MIWYNYTVILLLLQSVLGIRSKRAKQLRFEPAHTCNYFASGNILNEFFFIRSGYDSFSGISRSEGPGGAVSMPEKLIDLNRTGKAETCPAVPSLVS